jgi:hypothetical protein
MTAAEARKARRDARELAATRPADPYRGALTDPYAAPTVQPGAATQPGTTAQPGAAGSAVPLAASAEPRSSDSDYQPPAGHRTPGQAVLAGILAIGLGATSGLFGLLLLAIVSLQEEYGAPDRSFYQGSDSSYVLLALLDFVLGACLVVGGISLLTGRLAGRLLITIAGWTVLALCAFWWVQASVTAMVPLVVALLSLGMLVLCYQARVTRWLGVLPAAQPE